MVVVRARRSIYDIGHIVAVLKAARTSLSRRVAPGLGGRRVPAGRERLYLKRGRVAAALGELWRLCRLAVELAQRVAAAKGREGLVSGGRRGARGERETHEDMTRASAAVHWATGSD